jgi:hypothetical protein
VCQLEKIVSGADDGPLGAHLFDAAQPYYSDRLLEEPITLGSVDKFDPVSSGREV